MASIKILELDIDVESIIAKSAQLKATLDQLREKQDSLKRSGDTASETYVKNAATIAKVSTAYRENQNQLTALTNVNGKYLSIQDKISLAVDKEVTSIGAARTSNSELLKIRNELNLKTEDGAKAADLINKKLDENNSFIKENVSSLEKQKINVGNYKESITDALNETGFFSGALGDLRKVLGSVSGVFGLLKKDFGESFGMITNATKGTEGLSGAQKGLAVATNIGTGAMRIFTLALAATGIGLIIAAIVLLIGYFKTLDPVVDKIEQGIAGVGAAIRVAQQFIVALISDAGKLANAFLHPIDTFKSLGKEMATAAKAAANLKEQQQDLADAQAIQSVANKKQEAEIARLMLMAKNRSLTEQERIDLLNKAEKLNQDNFKANAVLAEKEYAQAIESARINGALTDQEVKNLEKVGVAYAYKLLNIGKITQEEVDLITKAEESKIEIYNRATANQEKIQNKQDAAFEKAQAEAEARAQKAAEARQKRLDDAVAKSKAELDLFISQQGIKAKSLQDELAIAEKVRDKRLQIAQQEFDASKKTETDKLNFLTEQNNIKDEFLQKQVDATIANAQRELDIFTKSNQSKVDSNQFFSDIILEQEKRRLELQAEAEAEFQALRLEQGVINEQAYQDAIAAIQDETRIKKEEAEAERKVAAEEQQAIDLENILATEETLFQNSLELQLRRLDQKRQIEIKEAEKTGANTTLIERKYAALKRGIEDENQRYKLQQTANYLGQAAGLFKENTTAFKALSIAQAGITTYLAATEAYAAGVSVGGPAALATGALYAGIAVAAGLANIAKIAGVKFARGGILDDPNLPGTSTSDSIPAQLSKGESVINAKSTAMFTPLLSYINTLGGGVAFGGAYPNYASNNFGVQSAGAPIDYDLLAAKIGENVAQANRSLPAPRMALDEFHQANQQYLSVQETASHG